MNYEVLLGDCLDVLATMEAERFETLAWLYGSGFPKSLNVSKAFDKAAGTDVEIGKAFNMKGKNDSRREEFEKNGRTHVNYHPVTELAKEWDGWGTALKPAFEPIILARKPFAGSVIQNIEKHRTGAINIDECRVETDSPIPINRLEQWSGFGEVDKPDYDQELNTKGRFPANVIHDGSDEVLEIFPAVIAASSRTDTVSKGMFHGGDAGVVYPDSGSAARFFYCAKASQEDRDEGLFGFEKKAFGQSGGAQQALADGEEEYQKSGEASVGLNVIKFVKNYHPTVKPTDLMRYLCRLITPPNGTVLDPFCGSGSTGKAAVLEGFNFVGIELNEDYSEIARARIKAAAAQGRLF